MSNSMLLMNGFSSDFSGQIFFNSGSSRVTNSDLAGPIGMHNHYVGSSYFTGGKINAYFAINPTYWETITRFTGTEIIAESLFWRGYPNLKRNSPVPIWFDADVTLNGERLAGMYVRHPEHSQFFDTLGSPIYSGVRVVPEQAYYLEEPNNRNFRSVTPIGNTETQTSYMTESFEGWEASIARGDLGYPHGFPAGEYLVKYYTKEYGDFIREETVTLGSAPTPNRPPIVSIVNTQNFYPDTDQSLGETITFEGRASDPDGDDMRYEWLLDDVLVSTELTGSVFVSDGPHTMVLRVVDEELNESSDILEFSVEAYVPPVEDWEQKYNDLKAQVQKEVDDLQLILEE